MSWLVDERGKKLCLNKRVSRGGKLCVPECCKRQTVCCAKCFSIRLRKVHRKERR